MWAGALTELPRLCVQLSSPASVYRKSWHIGCYFVTWGLEIKLPNFLLHGLSLLYLFLVALKLN